MLVVWLGISAKMSQNNAFTVAKRTLEGQDMIYQSLKLSNGIWALVGKRTFTYITVVRLQIFTQYMHENDKVLTRRKLKKS